MVLALSVALAEPLPDGECRCFTGEANGNDRVRLDGRLCRAGSEVSGRFDWTGARSGTNAREVEGTVSSDGVLLRDVAIPAQAPEAGWRFCAIDRWVLAPTASGGLGGRYSSLACRDEATVALEPMRCTVRGPDAARVPDEVEACRRRGYLWLSDPDAFERTEIETAAGWLPVWQVQDRHGGRVGRILVYPESCRVVVRIETPTAAGVRAQIVPPTGTVASAAEVAMLDRWALAAR